MLFKRFGKKVHYNDRLAFNQVIGKAIIQNGKHKVSKTDIETVLTPHSANYPTVIQDNFKGVFFLDSENEWLDMVVTNIGFIENEYKRYLCLAALFQACLAKRPFNKFHRANLDIRTKDVTRTFGNKTTWETSFGKLFKRYVAEYNSAVFSNGQRNKVIGGYDALQSPNGVDLVYIDPPYVRSNWSEATDYLYMYHFLEGLTDYDNWMNRVDVSVKSRRIRDTGSQNRFLKKTDMKSSFFELMDRFQDNILVISYRESGVPSLDEIQEKLLSLNKKITVFRKSHKYVLSDAENTELLIIGK